jgi:hypothetical protein
MQMVDRDRSSVVASLKHLTWVFTLFTFAWGSAQFCGDYWMGFEQLSQPEWNVKGSFFASDSIRSISITMSQSECTYGTPGCTIDREERWKEHPVKSLYYHCIWQFDSLGRESGRVEYEYKFKNKNWVYVVTHLEYRPDGKLHREWGYDSIPRVGLRDTFELRYAYDLGGKLLTEQRWVRNEMRWQSRYEYPKDTLSRVFYTSKSEPEYLIAECVTDKLGRLIRKTTHASPAEKAKVGKESWFSPRNILLQTYHANGKLKSYLTKGSNSPKPTQQFNFGYDNLGRLTSLKGEKEFTLTYTDQDPWADLITQVCGLGEELKFYKEFDARGNPTLILINQVEKNIAFGNPIPVLHRKVEVSVGYW